MRKLQEHENFLREFYPSMGAKYCANELCVSPTDIRIICSYLKIRTNNFLRREKYPKIDESYFINNINQYSAYILGFLWADGHINKEHPHINLEIKTSDAIQIAPIFNKVGNWTIRTRQRYRGINKFGESQTTFFESNSVLHKWLTTMDFKIKSIKSPTKLLICVPDEYTHYFWRGFFDGDGNLYTATKYEFSFWGGIDQDWGSLMQLLAELNISYKIRREENKKRQGYSQVYCCNISGVNAFIAYISRGETFGLDRKRLVKDLIDCRSIKNNLTISQSNSII